MARSRCACQGFCQDGVEGGDHRSQYHAGLGTVKALVVSNRVVAYAVKIFSLPMDVDRAGFVRRPRRFAAARSRMNARGSKYKMIVLRVRVIFSIRQRVISRVGVSVPCVRVNTQVDRASSHHRVINGGVSAGQARARYVAFNIGVHRCRGLMFVNALFQVQGHETRGPLAFERGCDLRSSAIGLLLYLTPYQAGGG